MTAIEPNPELSPDIDPRDRRFLYLIGLTAIVGLLAVAAVARRPRRPTVVAVPPLEGTEAEDWRESLGHFASAIDIRFAGLETQIGDIARKVQSANAVASAVVPAPVASGEMEPAPPPRGAAVSIPTDEAMDERDQAYADLGMPSPRR